MATLGWRAQQRFAHEHPQATGERRSLAPKVGLKLVGLHRMALGIVGNELGEALDTHSGIEANPGLKACFME